MTGTPDPGMLKRDRGRCAACGIDALALLAALKEMRWAVIEALKYGHHHYALYGSQAPAWLEFLAGIGLTDHDVFTRRRLWDADHIRAVSEGGGNVLENLQTLCLPCHRAKTRMWHGARAEQRRARIEVLEQAWRQGVLV